MFLNSVDGIIFIIIKTESRWVSIALFLQRFIIAVLAMYVVFMDYQHNTRFSTYANFNTWELAT